jgi:hypothetical protein
MWGNSSYIVITNYPKIDIESMFDELVRDHGGAIVLREKLSKSPIFNNADNIFHFEKIIAELKCLTEDNIDSASNRLRTNRLVEDYYSAGKIRSRTIDESNWNDLPRELQTRIYEFTTRSIKKRIQKADIQIRETKRELNLDQYRGLLVLANDGIVSLPPAAFIQAALLVLRRSFREINYLVYLTANLLTALRETPMPTLFWIGVDLQKGPKMDVNFTDRLGRNWRRLVCRKTGIPGFEQELRDIEGFWRARHIDLSACTDQ